MTTSNFPANTFSIYAGRRRNPAFAAIAARQRRVHRWSRPLVAAIVATAFTFTALAAFRDGGASIEASWRDASRPDVVVRHRPTPANETSHAPATTFDPSAPAPGSNAPMVASLTGAVPGLIGGSRPAAAPPASAAASAAAAEPASAAPSRAVRSAAAPAPAPARPPAPAPTPKPVSRARAKSALSALDKLGSDITAKLK
jgi:hypothetical protein